MRRRSLKKHLIVIAGISIGTITMKAQTSCSAFSGIITRTTTTASSSTIRTAPLLQPLCARPKSKWDDLVDDDSTDDSDGSAPLSENDHNNDASNGNNKSTATASGTTIPVPSDMLYVERNVKRAHDTFLNLRTSGGKEVCNDVYAKSVPESPSSSSKNNNESVLWYVGKVAKISDVSLEDCIARQWNMIEHHASNLRPIELKPYRSSGRIELWTAPGDSELDIAYNRPDKQMIRMRKNPLLTNKDIKNNCIGFQGEVYQDMTEEGFRTWRDEDGYPVRAEINPGGESRPPNQEEYAQLQKELNDRNLSVEDLYKDQQERMNE